MTETPEPISDHEDVRRHFDAELEAIRHRTLGLGSLVLENVKRLGDAVLENDLDLARQVVAADDEIDEAYSRLEREAFAIIARQQPVARDLRLLISITRILYELERSGDLALNCASGLLRHDGYRIPEQVRAVLARLFSATTGLFGRGLDALAEMDEGAGAELDRQDDEVDGLTREFYRHIVGDKGRMDDIDLAVEMSRMGRYLERIGDHAVNVGEHVTFVETGSFLQDHGQGA